MLNLRKSRFAARIGLLVTLTFLASDLTLASSMTLPETVKFVVDKTGRYIVPPTTCKNVKYVGCGLYLTDYNDGGIEPDLHDYSGKQVKYHLPDGCKFAGIAADARQADNFKTYANNTVVFYNNPASKKFPDEGVCDLSGHVLIAPAGLEFTRYMENGVLFAEGDAPYQIVVIQKDGKVLSRLEQDQAEKLGYVLPNLLSENDCFSDGRCPIEKSAGRLTANASTALLDTDCKILAELGIAEPPDQFQFDQPGE